MDLGRLTTTLALGLSLLGTPTSQAQSQTDNEPRRIEVCQTQFDINDAVEEDLLQSMRRSQYFFQRHDFDLQPVKDGDCIDIEIQSAYNTIDTIIPDKTGYDAHDFVPDHDTTMQAMAEHYSESINDAYDAAMDSLETLPAAEAVAPMSALTMVRESRPSAYGSQDSVFISPYQVWSESVRKSQESPDVTDARRENFVVTEMSRVFSHELLHTYGLPHPWDWKEQEPHTEAPFTNVMAYGFPRLTRYEGEEADSAFAYTMSPVQTSILDQALTKHADYHALQDTTNLEQDYDAFTEYWKTNYPDVNKADYIDSPYNTIRDQFEAGVERLQDN